MSTEMITAIATAGTSVFVALASSIVAVLKTFSAKKDAERAKNEYASALLKGAYLVCPKCGQKIMLKDIEWLFERN